MRRKILNRICALAALIAATGATGVAAAPELAPNEFRRAGATLACVTSEEPEGPSGMRGCLRMGPLQIGMSLFEVSRELGEPYRVVEQGGATLRVYVISVDVPPNSPLPYWVVGFRDGRVSSIQMTGERGDDGLAFSSIRLGDPKARVVEILGEPYMTRDVDDVKAEFWGYSPFPISLEVKAGKVYSIRISDESGR